MLLGVWARRKALGVRHIDAYRVYLDVLGVWERSKVLGVRHIVSYRVYADVVRGMSANQSVRGWAHRCIPCVFGCCLGYECKAKC